MIVVTAGHVDHGKTALIQALTSARTDRLPEEQRRGMTIDLGYAWLSDPRPDGHRADPVMFIDVPGHERFIRNLLSGFVGIDFALLVIAADDGPMPQTREHLQLLDLLAVRTGAVALTKTDRAAAHQLAKVRARIDEILAPTSLAGAPVFPVSAVDGRGVAQLRRHILAVAGQLAPRSPSGNFRMAIDRSFRIAGAGLVVTGTVASGTIRPGEAVRAGSGVRFRIRAIQTCSQEVGESRAGQRCALNLAGIGQRAAAVSRGDWILGGSAPDPVDRFDARLRLTGEDARTRIQGDPLHLHLGTAHCMAKVVLLDDFGVPGADHFLAQILSRQALGAARGDRFVLREAATGRPVGGGTVLDIFPVIRGRRHSSRLRALAAQDDGSSRTAWLKLLEESPDGARFDRFCLNRNLTAGESEALLASVPAVSILLDPGRICLSPEHWQKLENGAIDAIRAWHALHPELPGLQQDRLLAERRFPEKRAFVSGVVRKLVRRGRVVLDAGLVRLPSHVTATDPALDRLWCRIAPLLQRDAIRPPSVAQIAGLAEETEQAVRSALEQSTRLRQVIRVSGRHYFIPSGISLLADIFMKIAAENPDGQVTVIAFRDRSGIGRNLSVEVLEYFDHVRFSRRTGNARTIIRPPPYEFFARFSIRLPPA